MKSRPHSEIRCLKIDEKWVNLILTGRKSWELRRRNTNIREQIALGNKEIKRVVGYAKIVDSIEKTLEDLKKHNDKHYANDFIDKYANERKTLFAWVLEDIQIETEPKFYTYSTGSWCKIKS
jgi:hypothetical protein